MSSAPTVGEYRRQLGQLLAHCKASFTDEEQDTLRAVVRERRNRRRDRAETRASTEIARQSDAIVRVLESAARVLRPRETQELDDLVAGREPAEPRFVGRARPCGFAAAEQANLHSSVAFGVAAADRSPRCDR